MEKNNNFNKFFKFCQTFEYTNGLNERKYGCMSIFYNIMLVLNDKRLAMLIQDIDYNKDTNAFSKICSTVLSSFHNLEFIATHHGMFIFLKEKEKDVRDFYDCTLKTNNKIGLMLSYPCFDHQQTKKFASLNVQDEFGNHQLFANWYEDDGTVFYDGILNMAFFIKETFDCRVYVEYYNVEKTVKQIYI